MAPPYQSSTLNKCIPGKFFMNHGYILSRGLSIRTALISCPHRLFKFWELLVIFSHYVHAVSVIIHWHRWALTTFPLWSCAGSWAKGGGWVLTLWWVPHTETTSLVQGCYNLDNKVATTLTTRLWHDCNKVVDMLVTTMSQPCHNLASTLYMKL